MIGLTIGLVLGSDQPSTGLDGVPTLNERTEEDDKCSSDLEDAWINCHNVCLEKFGDDSENECRNACYDGLTVNSNQRQNLKDHLDHDMDMEDSGDETSKWNERKKGKKKGGKQGEPSTCEALLLKAKEACGISCDKSYKEVNELKECKTACSEFKKTG